MDAQLLLYRPTEYFRHFERRSTSLFVALGVFFLLAVVEAAGAGGIPTRSEVRGAVLGVLLNWLLNTFLFGVLWFFLGARFVGGRATLGTTVRAVGYAFLWPGVISLATILVLKGTEQASPSAALTSVSLRAALGLWALGLAVIGVKYVHALTWARALVVFLWFPVSMLALVVGLVIIGIIN